jgi:hypothetical protein
MPAEGVKERSECTVTHRLRRGVVLRQAGAERLEAAAAIPGAHDAEGAVAGVRQEHGDGDTEERHPRDFPAMGVSPDLEQAFAGSEAGSGFHV